MRFLCFFVGGAVFISLNLACVAVTFAQGNGESISFLRNPRFNGGQQLEDVFTDASSFASGDGITTSMTFPVDPSQRGDNGANSTETTIASGPTQSVRAQGMARAVVFPGLGGLSFGPNLVIGTSANANAMGSVSGGTGSAQGSITTSFSTTPGLATPVLGPPEDSANTFATMSVLIHFLILESDPEFASGSASASVGNTNLSVSDMGEGVYSIQGHLASTHEGLRDYPGQDFFAVAGTGGVNQFVATREAVSMFGQQVNASASASISSNSDHVDEQIGPDPNDVELIVTGPTNAQSNVSVFFSGNDLEPLDMLPAGTPVVIVVTTNPGDNTTTLGPLPVLFNGNTAIAIATEALGSIEVGFAGDGADTLQSEIQLVRNGRQDTVLVTLTESSPEVSYTYDSETESGQAVIDFSALNLAPGLYTINIGDGYSQQYYIPLLGDVNRDGLISFADIPEFISAVQGGPDEYRYEADIDQDLAVNFLDIPLFIALLLAK